MKPQILLERITGDTDFDRLLLFVRNEGVMRGKNGHVLTHEEAEDHYSALLAGQFQHLNAGSYQVRVRETNELIGFCALRLCKEDAELEYYLLPSYLRRGYATDLVAILLQHARSIPTLNAVRARIAPENLLSEQALLKNGFSFEKTADVPGSDSVVSVYRKRFRRNRVQQTPDGTAEPSV